MNVKTINWKNSPYIGDIYDKKIQDKVQLCIVLDNIHKRIIVDLAI